MDRERHDGSPARRVGVSRVPVPRLRRWSIAAGPVAPVRPWVRSSCPKASEAEGFRLKSPPRTRGASPAHSAASTGGLHDILFGPLAGRGVEVRQAEPGGGPDHRNHAALRPEPESGALVALDRDAGPSLADQDQVAAPLPAAGQVRAVPGGRPGQRPHPVARGQTRPVLGAGRLGEPGGPARRHFLEQGGIPLRRREDRREFVEQVAVDAARSPPP